MLDESGVKLEKTHFKIANEKYGKRQPINKLFDKKYESILKNIFKVGDYIIQLELINHLNLYKNKPEEAFLPEGIDDFNQKRILKRKKPIFRLRFCESGSKRFSLGNNIGNKHKQMEATDGNNLFFAIYWDERKQKRNFETIPLNKVITHQKKVAHLKKEQRTSVDPNPDKGKFLFTISPNDLVYVPTNEEFKNPDLVDFTSLNKKQIKRVYKMVSTTKGECHFIPNTTSKEIKKNENGTNSKNERIQLFYNEFDVLDIKNNLKGKMIKECCWKLKINRLGKIIKVQL